MMGLPIIELTKEQRLRVPSAMRAEYERNRSGLFVLVFSDAVPVFSAAVLAQRSGARTRRLFPAAILLANLPSVAVPP